MADSVRTEDITPLPGSIIEEIHKKFRIKEDNFNSVHADETEKRLMNVVKSIFRLAMKKSYLINDMEKEKTITRLEKINIPVKLNTIDRKSVV